MTFTKQSSKRVLKEAGAEMVSDSAAIEFMETVNKFAYKVAKQAVKLAVHAKRKTVKREDVELAT